MNRRDESPKEEQVPGIFWKHSVTAQILDRTQ
jgi:hypothetical protein